MTLHIELDLDPTVNFAMQQNDVPMVKTVRLRNEGAEELRELVVHVWGEPAFMLPWSGRVAAIAPGSTYNIELPAIELSATFLLELTERLVGAVCAEVVRDGQTVGQFRQKIEVLAREQWSGMRSLPEILTAFILPNHPVAVPVTVLIWPWSILKHPGATFSVSSATGPITTAPKRV
jgi:hypothetical protein